MNTRSVSTVLATLRSALMTGGLVALAVLTTGIFQSANAGCLDVQAAKKMALNWFGWQRTPQGGALMKTGFVQVGDYEFDPYYRAPITGLWHFNYISEGNSGTLGIRDGAVVDGGNTLWFADGNEITYSGMRDPNTGATCLGVWKRTGEHTYELNHIGLSWNPNSSPPASAGPAFIKQYVTLAADRNHYTGWFTINQLNADGKTPTMPTIKGRIVATRVELDTTTQPPVL
jgi:hypothetical protein